MSVVEDGRLYAEDSVQRYEQEVECGSGGWCRYSSAQQLAQVILKPNWATSPVETIQNVFCGYLYFRVCLM